MAFGRSRNSLSLSAPQNHRDSELKKTSSTVPNASLRVAGCVSIVGMFFDHHYDPRAIWEDPTFTSSSSSKYVKLGTEGVALFEFVAFWLDPLLPEQEVESRLTAEVLPAIIDHFSPFVQYYPFFAEPGTIQIEKKDGIPYIYGAQECPESLDEELLRGLLFDFSSKYKDLYIHISDEDYLLCRHYESLPKWLEPEVSQNRVWINDKRALVIPPQMLHPGLSLSMGSAVPFLTKSIYKCPNIPVVTEYLERSSKNCIEKSLAETVDIEEVRLATPTAQLFERYPWLISTSFIAFAENGGISKDSPEGEARAPQSVAKDSVYDVGIPDWMNTFIESQNTFTTSEVLQKGLNILMSSSKALHEEYRTISISPGTHKVDLSRQKIQKVLISLGRLSEVVPPQDYIADAGASKQATSTEDELRGKEQEMMDKVKEFFGDKDAVTKIYEDEDKYDGHDEEDEGDADANDPDDPDFDAKRELKDAGVDIDEDDFFEFFLKNALHLKDKEIGGFMATKPEAPEPPKKRKLSYNDESDYTSDEGYFPDHVDYGDSDDDDDDDAGDDKIESSDDVDLIEVKDSIANLLNDKG